MKILSILLLSIVSLWADAGLKSNIMQMVDPKSDFNVMPVIDSTDFIIINIDFAAVYGQIIEIPVFIQSDEVINALDFSMVLNESNLEFESVIDHTGNLQFAAHFNPTDLKLRFTSNSFSSYPVDPVKTISIRFRVLSGALFPSDMQSLIGYLNGDRCKTVLQFSNEVLPVSNKEIIVNETFLHPNPATSELFIQSTTAGTLELFDIHGRLVMPVYPYEGDQLNPIQIAHLPDGNYTARLITGDNVVKVQQVVIQ